MKYALGFAVLLMWSLYHHSYWMQVSIYVCDHLPVVFLIASLALEQWYVTGH